MRHLTAIATVFALLCPSATLRAQEGEDKIDRITLSDGKITLPVPADWERKQPRTRIVEHEFEAPGPKAPEGEPAAKPARVTIMGAGGGVEANIDRWIGQFSQPDGSNTREKAKTEKSKIAGAEVHIVDITGTYMDRPGGPFAGGRVVPREGYRMLGAIIVTPNSGHYFIKVLGDAETVEANVKPLKDMLKKLEIN